MKIRLGAVGSPEFLGLLAELTPEFALDYDVTAYNLETLAETLAETFNGTLTDTFNESLTTLPHLVNQANQDIDLWITDDPAGYDLAVVQCPQANVRLVPVEVAGLLPSHALLRQFLLTLKFEAKTKRLEQSQIAIQIVQVANFNQLMDKDSTLFYDVYRLYLKTQELLLRYTEIVLGSFVSIGNGRFMIFSTRGIMEQNHAAATLLLHQIDNLTHLSANIGMGYGITALEAEKNARLALNYAEQADCANCIFLVDEYGNVRGPLQEPSEVSFKFRTDRPDLIHKLQAAKISIATYEKMLSVQKASHQKSITASTVSELLHMSERNARKILATLQSHGLAQIVGLETPTAKGRPRQVYKIQES